MVIILKRPNTATLTANNTKQHNIDYLSNLSERCSRYFKTRNNIFGDNYRPNNDINNLLITEKLNNIKSCDILEDDLMQLNKLYIYVCTTILNATNINYNITSLKEDFTKFNKINNYLFNLNQKYSNNNMSNLDNKRKRDSNKNCTSDSEECEQTNNQLADSQSKKRGRKSNVEIKKNEIVMLEKELLIARDAT